MYDQNIQDALNRLDKSSRKPRYVRFGLGSLFGILLTVGIASTIWLQDNAGPNVSEEQLSRMIVIASRNSDNDPIRLLGDVERFMGKKVQQLSRAERADALGYLIEHIDLHQDRQLQISY